MDFNPRPSVTILLASRDGATHLPAQLDSITGQRGADWRLLWHDDGSGDASPTILRDWSARSGGRAAEMPGAASPRRGAAGSFLALLAAAPPSAHYAYCDQDDVWLPDKLERAAASLATVPPEVPALYCARQRIVGADLKPLGLSPLPGRPLGVRNALVQNVATGCTVVINAAARDLLLQGTPATPALPFHDWWAYLLVAAAGGTVLYDTQPSLLYRQHGGNEVGARPGFLARAHRAMRRGSGPFLRIFLTHLQVLQGNRHLLSAQGLGALDATWDIVRRDGALGRLQALHRAGLYRQQLWEDLAMRAWIARWNVGPEP